MPADLVTLSILLVIAFVPPVILAVRLRNAESRRREPWRALVRAFLWGAVPAAFLAIAIEVALDPHFATYSPLLALFPVTTVVLAPVIEEVAKGLGLLWVRDEDPEPADGFVYGGAAGLGFAATENVVYILSAFLLGGEDIAMRTALYRGIATVALHGACTAIVGYGIWRARYQGRILTAVASLVLATALHIGYNALASLAIGWSTLAAAGLALVAYLAMMRRVAVLDGARA